MNDSDIMADEALGVDYSKWKVNDLKKSLKEMGLSTVGNKSELIERLQGKVESDAGLDARDLEQPEDIDEDEVLGADIDDSASETNNDSIIDTPPERDSKDLKETAAPVTGTTPTSQASSKKITLVRKSLSEIEKENKGSDDNVEIIKDTSEDKTNNVQTKPSPERQVIKISSVSLKERLEMRAQKFGTPLSEEAKRAARAERFGVTSTGKGAASIGPSVVSSIDVLKKRAERFGCTTATKLVQSELEEKRLQRAKRFKSDVEIV